MEPFEEISREWAAMRSELRQIAAELDQVKRQLAERTPPELLTFAEFTARYPSWTEGKLRWKRFHQATNGFAAAFVEDGSRVLVNPHVFFEVLTSSKRKRR